METQDMKKEVQAVETVKEESTAEVANNAAQSTADAASEGTRFEHIKETLDLLYKHFPKAFIKDGDARPLKIGIFDDLKAAIADKPELSISKVRAALRLYTTRLRYLFCLKEDAKRIDLEGNEVEVVTKEHADFAKDCFKEINDKRKASKPKKPQGEKKTFKKKPFNKDNANKGPRADKQPQKVNGIKPTVADLTEGKHVLVLSSETHFVHGTVAKSAQKDTVSVTLQTGMTISLPLDRILLPQEKK